MSKAEKRVPNRRFREFVGSGEWEEKQFKELADIVRGASPRPIQDPKWFDELSDIGWLRISDVTEQNGRINQLEQRISNLAMCKTRILMEPHLLLSIAATVGKPVINYVKTGVHDGFLIFLSPAFEHEYMFQWLEMFRPQWQRYGQPGSQVNLNSDLVKNHSLFLPNKQEQTKIGEFFQALDNSIALQKRKLEKAKALKAAYLAEMFPAEGENKPKRRFAGFAKPWELKKLGEIAAIVGGGTPSTDNPQYWNGDVDWYTPAEINMQNYVSNSQRTITKLGLQSSSATILPVGTILFTSRAGIGSTAILSKEGTTNQGFQSIVPNQDILSSYFLYSRSHELKAYGEANGAGSTFVEISGKQMARMTLLVPSLPEQTLIGNFFKKLDETISLHQRKLEKLQQTKQAFLNELFV